MVFVYATQASLFFIPLLAFLSYTDCKYRQIENDKLLPILIVGLSSAINNVFLSWNPNIMYILAFLLIGITFSLLMYKIGFFGGADLKIFMIIIIGINPITHFGITSHLDGLQLLYYLILVTLSSIFLRLIRNLFVHIFTNYKIPLKLNAGEYLFLASFHRIRKLNRINKLESITFMVNSKNITIQQSTKLNSVFLCWTNRRLPMYPLILVSLILTLFT